MRIRTVLSPVDFTPLSKKELDVAVAVCRRYGAKLIVEHNVGVAPPLPMGVEWMWLEGQGVPEAGETKEAGRRLKALVGSLPPEVHAEGRLVRGPVDAGLIFAAADVEADLIVMGSHGWGGVDHHSVTEVIIARAPCPVLALNDTSSGTDLFGAETPARGRRALVPVGLTRWSIRSVEMALVLSRDLGMRLTLVHVPTARRSERLSAFAAEWEGRRQEALERRVKEMAGSAAAGIEFVTAHGKPGEEIVRLAKESRFDLVVMGGHHGGIFRHLFSEPIPCSVLHACACPVWFVPARLRRAPVEDTVAA
ncbi:MAG TPA: universal stress protein [Candidatus Saccharimonadales bacterium]|nr:universal stress protein [Candidatus Saccharimonadales bacterium]